jgi:hypothetical protein
MTPFCIFCLAYGRRATFNLSAPKTALRGKSYYLLVGSLMSTHEYIYPYTIGDKQDFPFCVPLLPTLRQLWKYLVYLVRGFDERS